MDPDKFQSLTIPLRVISRPPTLTDFYGMSITVILKKNRRFYAPRPRFGGLSNNFGRRLSFIDFGFSDFLKIVAEL